jgi:hypothetical protein
MSLSAFFAAAAVLVPRAAVAATTACDELARHGAEIATATHTPKTRFGIPYLHPWVVEAPAATPSRRLVLEAARLLDEDPDSVITTQPMGGGAWRAAHVAGSAECTTDVFLGARPGGGFWQIAQPDQFHDLCWTSGRDIGRMGGKTVLVEVSELDRPVMGTDVEITPWDGERWDPACRLAIRWRDAFKVSERFCADAAVCDAAAKIAPALAAAMSHSRDGEGLEAVAPPADRGSPHYAARLARMNEGYAELKNMMKSRALPTFGAKAKTPYTDYSTFYPTLVALDGKDYVALVGIGGIGWRELGDYLITLYREDDASQTPIAGIVVSRDPVGPPTVSVVRSPTPSPGH